VVALVDGDDAQLVREQIVLRLVPVLEDEGGSMEVMTGAQLSGEIQLLDPLLSRGVAFDDQLSIESLSFARSAIGLILFAQPSDLGVIGFGSRDVIGGMGTASGCKRESDRESPQC
jgi:hypothetical protein